MAEWIRIRLLAQRTQVPSLVPEDATGGEATEPVHELSQHTATARAGALQREAATARPCTAVKRRPCSLRLEKALMQQ